MVAHFSSGSFLLSFRVSPSSTVRAREAFKHIMICPLIMVALSLSRFTSYAVARNGARALTQRVIGGCVKCVDGENRKENETPEANRTAPGSLSSLLQPTVGELLEQIVTLISHRRFWRDLGDKGAHNPVVANPRKQIGEISGEIANVFQSKIKK